MRFNSIITSLLILTLFASLSFAMSSSPKLPKEKWDPAVQGIRLGNNFEDVIAALGKPQSRKDKAKSIVLSYEGLTIEIDRTSGDSAYVSSVEIDAPKWEVIPKIKVGMPQKDVQKTLGQSLHQEERDDQIWIWWWHESPRFDSLFSVTFENGKAIKIMFSEDKSI